MEFLKIIYLSFGSVVVLFLLTKLMGNREMAQLSMFDYIVSITIGSIAAEMATALEDDFYRTFDSNGGLCCCYYFYFFS